MGATFTTDGESIRAQDLRERDPAQLFDESVTAEAAAVVKGMAKHLRKAKHWTSVSPRSAPVGVWS